MVMVKYWCSGMSKPKGSSQIQGNEDPVKAEADRGIKDIEAFLGELEGEDVLLDAPAEAELALA